MANIMLGLQQLADPAVLVILFLGVLLGLTVGALPGLNDSITIAVLIPVTFGMRPALAFALLVGIYVSSACGGSIPAVLLDIPGTASAMVTAVDGYQLRKKGHGLQALSICMTSSFFGGLSSSIVLLFFSPLLAGIALRFGPPEYCMLAVLGLATVIGMAGRNAWRHFLSLLFGLWLACIGISSTTGTARFTFGALSLMDGIPLVPEMIGMFGILSVIKIAEGVKRNNAEETSRPASTGIVYSKDDKIALPSLKMCKRLLPTWLRASAIGNLLGALPGAGMTMAIYTSYDMEKRLHPEEEFGTGVLEGVAGPEAANNAVVASSMVPLLSLGVPGNGTAALFIGALTIHGLVAGPTLFTKAPDTVFLIIMCFVVGNLMMLPLALLFCKYLASQVLRINPLILSSAILTLCMAGCYAYKNNIFHVGVAVFFGVLGYLFYKFDIPQSPFILANVLGTMMETNFVNSMAYTGSAAIFLQRPISLILVIASALLIAWPWISPLVKRVTGKG